MHNQSKHNSKTACLMHRTPRPRWEALRYRKRLPFTVLSIIVRSSIWRFERTALQFPNQSFKIEYFWYGEWNTSHVWASSSTTYRTAVINPPPNSPRQEKKKKKGPSFGGEANYNSRIKCHSPYQEWCTWNMWWGPFSQPPTNASRAELKHRHTYRGRGS